MANHNNKKGDITVSLSWVFMIVIGVFFIILAYNIVGKYMANEEIKYQIELKNTLRTIFNDFGRTTGTEKNSLAKLGNIFRDSEVEIICSDGIPILSINDNYDANNEYLRSYPTFMTYINQKDVDFSYMAVTNFKMPFKITNMLAIVSRKNLIVIDSSSDIGEKLYEKFEKTSYNDLNYIYEDFNTLNQAQFIGNHVRKYNLNSIVFVTDLDSYFNITISEIKERSYLLEIDQTSIDNGIIKYTDQDSNTYEFIYIDWDQSLSLVSMAVFSSPHTFECSYEQLIASIENSYDFYINKTQYYMDYPDVVCLSSYELFNQQYYYSDFKDLLSDVKEEVKNNKFNNPDILTSNIYNMENQYYILENSNCPYIY